jgi:hypothetical protein
VVVTSSRKRWGQGVCRDVRGPISVLKFIHFILKHFVVFFSRKLAAMAPSFYLKYNVLILEVKVEINNEENT